MRGYYSWKLADGRLVIFNSAEGQLARWLEQLEEYTFDIVHRQGKLHTNADALSCLPGTEVQTEVLDTSVIMSMVFLPAYAPQDVRDCQLADSLVGPLLKAKEANEKPQFESGDPKWCKLVQLWDQLFVKMVIVAKM